MRIASSHYSNLRGPVQQIFQPAASAPRRSQLLKGLPMRLGESSERLSFGVPTAQSMNLLAWLFSRYRQRKGGVTARQAYCRSWRGY